MVRLDYKKAKMLKDQNVECKNIESLKYIMQNIENSFYILAFLWPNFNKFTHTSVVKNYNFLQKNQQPTKSKESC